MFKKQCGVSRIGRFNSIPHPLETIIKNRFINTHQNANGRIYPEGTLKKAVQEYMENVRDRRGEADSVARRTNLIQEELYYGIETF